jgi:hypothetical protein
LVGKRFRGCLTDFGLEAPDPSAMTRPCAADLSVAEFAGIARRALE